MAIWYYHDGNERKGPIEEVELFSLKAAGEIAPGTLIWKEGMEQWSEYQNVFPEPPGSPSSGHPSLAAEKKSHFPASPAGANTPMAMAIISVVLGVFGFAGCLCMPLYVFGVVAVVLGHLALNANKKAPDDTVKVLSIIGLVFGYLAILMVILFVIFMILGLSVPFLEQFMSAGA